MVYSDPQSLVQLFDRMETDSSMMFAGKQLACISKLVFYCGVQQGEITKLLIRDVIDNSGNIIREIHKFDKSIFLTDDVAEFINRHIAEMGNRNPTLVKRRSPLFPSYRNTRKLRRHWESFGVTYLQIHHAGIHYYYQMGLAAGKSKGRIYETGGLQKRISARQFQAIALNTKISDGKSVDDRCVEEIMRLEEQAEHLNKKDPNARSEAQHILEKFDETVRKIQSDELREEYGSLRSILQNIFKSIL
jgi:integrase